MQRRRSLVALALLVTACDGPVYRSPPPQSPSNAIEVHAGEGEAPHASASHDDHDDDHDEHDHDHDDTPIVLDERASRVLVLQTTELSRPAEVIGVVDAHEKMGHHDDALAHLKARAAAMGADAVVGVEFHHGEGEGEPTHLSGLAVRFLSSPP